MSTVISLVVPNAVSARSRSTPDQRVLALRGRGCAARAAVGAAEEGVHDVAEAAEAGRRRTGCRRRAPAPVS